MVDANHGAGRGPSLTRLAFEKIETLIVTLEIEPGTVLSESELCKRIGIGRTPVREALHALNRCHLVKAQARRGYEVDQVRIEDQFAHLELRSELDHLLVKLATRRSTPTEKEKFASLAQGIRQAFAWNDFDYFAKLDAEFNELCAKSCRNEFLATTMQMWNPIGRRFWFVNYGRDLPEVGVLSHAEIAEEISRNDEEKALQAVARLHGSIEATLQKKYNSLFGSR